MRFIPGMQGWFNRKKSMDIIHHVNRIKGKKHMTIQLMQKKNMKKWNTFMSKKKKKNPLNKPGVKGNYPNTI